MASTNTNDDDLVSAINVTPLVDVVLVLLVIFLITAPVLYQSAIKVQLPKASTDEKNAESPLSFTLDKAGDIAWGNEKLSWTEVESRLAKKHDENPEQTAVISADQATPHGTVIRLMDLLRKTGIVRFALNVDSGQP